MSIIYYHYTSRQFAQYIHCSGKLDSPTGINWISPDFFQSGAEAAQALAITRKSVEVACVIGDYAVHLALQGPVPSPTPVLGITDPLTGVLARKGGGNEIVINVPISLNPLQFVNLVSP